MAGASGSGLEGSRKCYDVQLSRIFVGVIAPPAWSDEGFAYDVVQELLAGGKTGRLYRALVFDRQVAQDVDMSTDKSTYGSPSEIRVTVKPGHLPAEVETLLDAELDRLAGTPPTAAELRRAQRNIEARLYRGLERLNGNGRRADLLNAFQMWRGDPGFVNQVVSRYRAVTPAQVQDSARKTLARVVLAVNPAAPHASANEDLHDPPRPRRPPRPGPAPRLRHAGHDGDLRERLRRGPGGRRGVRDRHSGRPIPADPPRACGPGGLQGAGAPGEDPQERPRGVDRRAAPAPAGHRGAGGPRRHGHRSCRTAGHGELRVRHAGRGHGDAGCARHRVLGGGFKSRLTANLRSGKGYTYGAFSVFDVRREPGLFMAIAPVVADKTPEALRELLNEIDRLREGGVDASELADAKSGLIQSLPAEFQSTSNTALAFGRLVALGRPPDYFAQYVQKVEAVTREDVAQAARARFDTRTLSIVGVGPLPSSVRAWRRWASGPSPSGTRPAGR